MGARGGGGWTLGGSASEPRASKGMVESGPSRQEGVAVNRENLRGGQHVRVIGYNLIMHVCPPLLALPPSTNLRLVEGPDHVLPEGVIYTRLAAHTRVNLGHDRGGHLHKCG